MEIKNQLKLLSIPSFGSFDSCVHDTFTTSHGVKKELSGRESRIEAVGDETFGSRELRISLEVRQTPIFKTIWDTLAVQGLLAHTRNHLRDIDEGTLGSAHGHDKRAITGMKLRFADVAGLVTDSGKL